MPVATLSAERVRALVPLPLSDPELEDLLFLSKAELEEKVGDELHLSVTPDRLDLLTEAGLSLYLGGATETATGLLRPPEHSGLQGLSVEVDASVVPLRPYIAAVAVRAPTAEGLDEGTLQEAIRFQELLHATVGRGRRAASLGVYPLERLTPPIRYRLEALDEVRFVPLGGTEEVPAARFFADHAMAAQYGLLGRAVDRCLTLRDSRGAVLSLPPVLNSRSVGEARPGDRDLLLESTGQSERAVREALGLLQVIFVARGWSVTAVPVAGPGAAHSDGRGVYQARSVDLASATLREIAGDAIPAATVERRLAMARLSPRPRSGGWHVEVPPWRPDIMTGVDLTEDIVLIGGVRPEQGLLLPSPTRGRRRPESRFRQQVRRLLLGFGLAQPYTPLLVSDTTLVRVPSASAVRIHNPVSAEFAFLRDRLLLSHLEVLGRNTRHPYPQRFAEVAPVVVRAERAEAGAETRYHAGAVLAGEGVGFADAAALVDYLLRTWDVSSVREPADLPATILGRGARVRVAGEAVAELGELQPEVLAGLGVPVPAVWAELDLTSLWPLVRRHETD
jgi:phenylalanyl-tRNA synthetase beta chain